MIILSDCMTETDDEGCIKVANSLAKKLKAQAPETTIISYGRKPKFSDKHLKLNCLFLNKHLHAFLRQKNEAVLYIPFASNTFASSVRTFVLSLFTHRRVRVIFALRFPMRLPAKAFLSFSHAKIISLSQASYRFYQGIPGCEAVYLKTGIDVEKFVPVSVSQKAELRRKYGIPIGMKVLLHVGHLKKGRNIEKLLEINDQYHIILVVSSTTKAEKDMELLRRLTQRGKITIIESYLENIQEVYQMADVYLFPVQEVENCIDVPLSVLEAAACNLPIVTTDYGELSAFKGQKGFLFVEDLSGASLNSALDKMVTLTDFDNRAAIIEYDWNRSVEKLIAIL